MADAPAGDATSELMEKAQAMVEVASRQHEWSSMQQMKQLVRVCCLEVMGAAPQQLEVYKEEVRELQNLVAEFRREVAELKHMGMGGGEPLTEPDAEAAGSRGASTHPPSSPIPEAHPPASSSPPALGATPAPPESAAPSAPLKRVYVELDGAPIQSWYENRPMPPVTVKLVDDQAPPTLFDEDVEVVLKVSLCNGRGLPEERTANGAQDLLVGDREVRVVNGHATFENLRIMEISQKHYGSFQLHISAQSAPAGIAVQPLRTKQFAVQVGRMWSKRRKNEEEISPDDPISQIPGVGKQYVSRLHVNGITKIRQFSHLCSTPEGKAMLQKMFKGDKLKNSLNETKFNQMVDQANKVMMNSAAARECDYDQRDDGGGAGGSDHKRRRGNDCLATPAVTAGGMGFSSGPPSRRTSIQSQVPLLPLGMHASASGAGTPPPPLHMPLHAAATGHAHAGMSLPLDPQAFVVQGSGGAPAHTHAPSPRGMPSSSARPHAQPTNQAHLTAQQAAHAARHAAHAAVGQAGQEGLSMDEIMTLFAEDVQMRRTGQLPTTSRAHALAHHAAGQHHAHQLPAGAAAALAAHGHHAGLLEAEGTAIDQ